MADRDGDVDELDLQAYLDGRLDRDPGRRAQVEAYLADHPAEQQRIRDHRAIADLIRDAHGGVLDEPVPRRLTDALKNEPAVGRHRGGSVAVAASLILAAGIGGWLAGDRGVFDADRVPDVRDAVANHRVEVENAAIEVSSAPPGAGVNAGSEKLVMAAPDLASIGYTLDRTEASERADVHRTTLYYRDKEGDVITLVFERPKAPVDTEPVVEEMDEVQSAHWRDGALRIVAIGDRIKPNIGTIQAAVDKAFQRLEKADRSPLPFGAPLMAEESGDAPAPSGQAAPRTISPPVVQ